MLSIQLLGAPQVQLDDQALNIPRRKSRALLYYLAAHTAPVTRDHILGLLWPDHDRSAAQQLLRTTLHGLRKLLGSALLTPDLGLALAPDSAIDVRRFVRLLDSSMPAVTELAALNDLYRGEFLADFSLPDCEDFERWLAGERERYRQLAARGLVLLAQQHEAHGQYAGALQATERALAFNPLQEELQRTAMRLHYLAGDRTGAIRRFEQLRRLLDDELGVPPMDATRALYDAIITDSLELNHQPPPVLTGDARPAVLSIVRPSSDTLPFIGRAAELEQLRSLAGSHKLALIEGEPGLGKTRLADECMRQFAGLTLVGQARELEQALPYQPIIEALRELLAQPAWPALRASLGLAPVWLAEIGRLLPELEVADPAPAARAPDESRLWEAVNQFLLALASRAPVALLLDDLHWGDASTLALLGYLVRQSTSAPIVFLATARPVTPRSPLAALLQTLTREDRLQRIPLARLSPADTVTLARQLSPTYAYPLADWLVSNGEGNPYILVELVRYAREHQLLQANGVLNLSELSRAPVVPGAIYSLIQSRLARLSAPARRVLDLAVAIGREFELEVVTRASGLAEDQVIDGLDELRAAALIAPLDGLRYGFDHTLTMEVAYREVGEARHRLIHRQVAEAIEQLHARDLDPVAGLLASHFAEGNAPERAAHYAFRAGQRAADLAAWAEAVAFFELALAGDRPEQREAIQQALGEAYQHTGSPARASEAYRSALALASARGDQPAVDQINYALSRALLAQSRFAEVIALARTMLASGSATSTVHAELAWGSALSIEGVDLAGATEHLNRAAAHCAAQSDPAVLAQITFELGSIAAQQGELPRAIELYRQALRIGETYPAATLYRILAQNNLAYHLLLLGDQTAIEHANAGLQLARELGILVFQPYLLSTLGEIRLKQGDPAGAEDLFNQGIKLAEQLLMPERVAGLTANLGLVAIARGQTALAIHRLSSALAQADALGTHHLAAQIRLWLVPLLPPAEAHATLAEARALAESGGRQRLLDAVARLERELAA